MIPLASVTDDVHAREERLRRAVDEHYLFVWRSLRRLGVAEEEADDVAEEVFLVFSRTADAPAATLAVDQLPNAVEHANVSDDTNVAPPVKAAVPALRRTARPEQVRSRPLAAEATVQGSESLRDEIEAIELASRALSQRRCGLAREHLAAYETRFPNGKLRREAEVVAIEIAGRSGDSQRARTAARRFVAQFPDTPYALRLAPWLRDAATEGSAPDGVVMCTDPAE